MSWLEYAPAAFAAIACLATCVACFARARRAERRAAELQAQVGAFSEASVRVADTLDALLRGQVTPAQESHQPSRRYVLAQAQQGLAEGQSLEQVTERLRLSHDEARLLGFAALGRQRQDAVRSTRNWAA
jgi:hypothetical protein